MEQLFSTDPIHDMHCCHIWLFSSVLGKLWPCCTNSFCDWTKTKELISTMWLNIIYLKWGNRVSICGHNIFLFHVIFFPSTYHVWGYLKPQKKKKVTNHFSILFQTWCEGICKWMIYVDRYLHPEGLPSDYTITMLFRILPETPQEPFALWEILDKNNEPLVGIILDSEYYCFWFALCPYAGLT